MKEKTEKIRQILELRLRGEFFLRPSRISPAGICASRFDAFFKFL